MKLRIYWFSLILGVVIIMKPVFAKDVFSLAFDKAIDKYQKQNMLNADFLVLKENVIMYRRSVGFADIERHRAFSEHTIFPIASITKQFTAAAILMLVDEGKIDLHRPIADFLPKEHAIWQGNMPHWANTITCHHLLTHTSGLESYTDEKIENSHKKKDILPAIVSLFKDKPLKFIPGSQFDYSNTGYLLLGIIIENISGKTLSDFFQERIFQPLTMSQTSLPDIKTEMMYIDEFPSNGDVPVPYRGILTDVKSKLTVVKHPFTIPLQGGAAMFSTLQDLRKWNEALYHGQVLSQQSLKMMTTPHVHIKDPLFGDLHYGYGIFIDNKRSSLLFKHGGWIDGARTMLSYSLPKQTTVIILSNVSPDENQSEDLMYQQANAFNDLADEMQQILS